jgi:sucrose phosphorylase
VDFESVDPNLGTWADIEALGDRYRLMFDGVFNRASSHSRWFQGFRDGDPYYSDVFIFFQSPDELTPGQRRLIFRPRTSDILTRFETIDGPRCVWTTFSEDQVDLNFRNPNVLLRVIEILLLYVRHGASIARLDAVAPRVALITETNVPHEENVSYCGNGTDEAILVYNFALPPLVLHAFHREDASALTRWARGLEYPSSSANFFNFLDSHGGIGIMGVRGVLPPEEIAFLVDKVREHGGYVSDKAAVGEQEEPYELNITWFSALNREDGGEDEAFQVRRFVATRVVALILRGIPGIDLHSMIGTRNDVGSVLATHSRRDINRAVIDARLIIRLLADPLPKIARIGHELGRLITIRGHQAAFHPNAEQRVLGLAPEVFAVWRTAAAGSQHILALVNVAPRSCRLEIHLADLPSAAELWCDLVSGMEWMVEDRVRGGPWSPTACSGSRLRRRWGKVSQLTAAANPRIPSRASSSSWRTRARSVSVRPRSSRSAGATAWGKGFPV